MKQPQYNIPKTLNPDHCGHYGAGCKKRISPGYAEVLRDARRASEKRADEIAKREAQRWPSQGCK